MTTTSKNSDVRSLTSGLAIAVRGASLACGALAILSPSAQAFDFSSSSGSLTGSWDTTVTYGQAARIQDSDCNLIAIADGGCGRSPNIDDGNLNFETGTYTRALKVVTELGLNTDHFGVFVRGSALYDDLIENSSTARTPLSDEAKDLVGSYVRLLDAFAYFKFDLGSLPAEIRLGSQVVSWGESTFIQGGINTVNHFDVSALRVPGAELKEGFMPQEMAFVSLGLTDNTSVEAFYLVDWDDTEPEPVGSYFSTNDFVPDGGTRVFLGFGGFSDQGVDFRPLGGPFITNFQAVPRGETLEPDDQGQFGVALRTYFPDFINGTEIGLFYINYHSRVPLISGRTGTQVGLGNAAGTATAEFGAAQGLARVLEVLDRHDVPATFFVAAVASIVDPRMVSGITERKRHEIGLLGWSDENVVALDDAAEESRLLARAMSHLTEVAGRKPVGARGPSGAISLHTMPLLKKAGVLYDSTLQARDEPYEVLLDGKLSGVVELPVNAYLNDSRFLTSARTGPGLLPSPELVFETFRDEFDVAYEEGTLFVLTLHPHVVGMRSRIIHLDQLIRYMKGKPGVWFATGEQIARYVKEQAGLTD